MPRGKKQYLCQQRDNHAKECGEECAYVAPWVEEAVVKAGKRLTRKPLGVQRIIWVDCPVHGRVAWFHMGHHLTMGQKRK